MNEPNPNNADNSQADFESYLKRFRPVETSASIAETFYQAGWRAAVAPQISSARKSLRGRWAVFLSGAACGMLPMLMLNNQARLEPSVARSEFPSAPPVPSRDEALHHVDVATSGDAQRSEQLLQPASSVPSAIHLFSESLMLRSWLPQLQISKSSMSSDSVLCFRPLTNDVMDLADIDEGASSASDFLTTSHDAAQAVDRREPLSARSSALNEDFLRELFL